MSRAPHRSYRPATDTGRDLEIRAAGAATRADLQIDRQRGWARPTTSELDHYFLRGVSLCQGFMWMGRVADHEGDMPGRCRVCRDRREDLAARGEVPR